MLLLGLWNGAGRVPWTLSVPNDFALLGLAVTLQGVFVDVAGGPVQIGLTTAARVVIGA